MSLEASVRVSQGGLGLDVELTARAGETVVVLGPNGSGKSTLLRALAGLVELDAGRVVLHGSVLDDVAAGTAVPPERRRIGMVFQDPALFPHLDALANVAFGLRCGGVERREAARQARAWLDRLDLGTLAGARPHSLSGGEAQRVALARALAVSPDLLLLDEPMGALDVVTRAAVRRELRRHLADFSGPRLLVTHDTVEAFALADRIVVIEDGRVVQTGSPAEIVARPRSPYVAELAGTNLFRGRARVGGVEVSGHLLSVAAHCEGEVLAVIEPRSVALHTRAPEGSPRNVWQATVDGLEPLGERVRVRVGGPMALVAEITPAALAEMSVGEGDPVWISVKATEIRTYPA